MLCSPLVPRICCSPSCLGLADGAEVLHHKRMHVTVIRKRVPCCRGLCCGSCLLTRGVCVCVCCLLPRPSEALLSCFRCLMTLTCTSTRHLSAWELAGP